MQIKFRALALAAGLALVAPLAIAPVFAAMTVMVGGAPMYPSKNIVENAVHSKDHTTLVAAVKAAGLVDTLERLPEGLTELMCHPGKLGPELRAARTRLKESREIELAALTSPEARRMIERRGIELVSYRDV